MPDFFNKVLNDICLNDKISNGIFKIDENSHMEVLRDYFINKGVDESLVVEFSNKVLEGKYPERQAYNSKGILVTFPTPEYKQRAISKGSHFEKDPTKQHPNIFSPSQPTTSVVPDGEKKETDDQPPKFSEPSELPASGATVASNANNSSAASTTSVAPDSATDITTIGPSIPISVRTNKSPQEKEAEKSMIKKIIASDDNVLEEGIFYKKGNLFILLNK
jgi:hypothetical protein